jgi:MFS family permease
MRDKRSKQVSAIAIITAICVMGDSMLYIVLPIYWKWFGLTALWQVGILLSVNRLIRLPINPIIGWFYQRFNRKGILFFSVLLAAFSTYTYGAIHDFMALVIARALWGVSWSFLRLGAFLAILDLADDRSRGRFLGHYNGLWRLGSLVGMLAGGILADGLGIPFMTNLFAGVALIGVPLIWLAVPKAQAKPLYRDMNNQPTTKFWKNRYALGALSTGLILSMVYTGILTSTLSRFIEISGMQAIDIFGWTIAAASISGGLQALRWIWEPFLAPLFGKWSDGKKGRLPFLIIGCFASGLLFFVMAFPVGVPQALICVLLIQLGATMLTTLSDALASDAASMTSKVALMTAYTVTVDLGASLGPSLAYFIIDWSNIGVAFGFTAFLLFLTGGGWFIHQHFSRGRDLDSGQAI